MLKSGYLPPVQNHNHGTTNCLIIPTPRVLLVWTSSQSYQRSRPPFHVPLQTSTRKRTCYEQTLVRLYGLGSLLYALGIVQNGVCHPGTPSVSLLYASVRLIRTDLA